YIAHLVLVIRVAGELLLLQAAVDEHLYDVVDHSKERHSDQHSHKSKQSASKEDSEDHPERRQSRSVPQDLRLDEIAVHLLQYDNEYNEGDPLHRVGQQDQHGAGDPADIGAKERNDVRHSHHHAHQHRI